MNFMEAIEYGHRKAVVGYYGRDLSSWVIRIV